LQYVNHIVSFVAFVYADSTRSDVVTRGAVGVLGDLAHALGPKIKQQLQQPFVKNVLNDCLKAENSQTREVAKWAKDVILKL